MAEPVFKDLDGLVRSLKGDLFARWMRRAQKQALIEWRDRTTAPGLMARFESSGSRFYDFSARRRPRLNGTSYLRSGALRDLLRRRKPKAKNKQGTDVVTVLKFGGGALNLLTNMRGVRSTGITRMVTSVAVRAYQRGPVNVQPFTRRGHRVDGFDRRGGMVRAYTISRASTSRTSTPASASYAAEFAVFHRDRPWIAKRTEVLFATIARRASVDRRTGGIKSSVLEGSE